MNNKHYYEFHPRQILKIWEKGNDLKRREILEWLGMPVIISDNKGKFLDVNTKGLYLLGYSRKSILESNFNSISFPEDIISNWHTLQKNRGIMCLRTRNGEARYFFVNTNHLGPYAIHFLVDATGFNRPEEALVISEQRYRSLVENAVDGMYVMNMNRFLYVNECLCEMLGYTSEEMVNLSPWDIMAESREYYKNSTRKIFKEQKIIQERQEYKLLRKDGKVITCEIGYCSIVYDGEYAFQGNIKNITERRQMEKKIKESEEKYRIVVENVFDDVCIYSGSKILYINKRLCESTGYSEGELLGKSLDNIIAPEYNDDFRKIVKRVLRGQEGGLRYQTDMITKAGIKKTIHFRAMPIELKGEPAVLMIARDISEKKRQELAKQRERRKINRVNRMLRILAESKGADEAYYDIIRAFKEEFPSYDFEIAFYEDENNLRIFSIRNAIPYTYIVSKNQGSDMFKAIKYNKKVFRDFNNGVVNKEDKHFYNSGYKYMMQLPMMGLHKVFGLFRCTWSESDKNLEYRSVMEVVSEISLAIESLIYRDKIAQITMEKAEQEKNVLISKFSLIGEMAASIAHEVRNPMTTVKGIAQLLLQDHPDKAYYYELMVEEIDRANRMLSEFLSLSKNSFSRREELNIIELLNRTMDLMYGELLLNEVNIKTNITIDSANVYGDGEQIKQAFLNIIKNAMEAANEGGMIYVKASRRKEWVYISIVDNGPGIDSAVVKHIMEPFFTTKENGTGLGLSVSYKIIKDHGGDLLISSDVNHGTVVKIKLPIVR